MVGVFKGLGDESTCKGSNAFVCVVHLPIRKHNKEITMATLVKHRDQYLSRVRKWDGVKQVTTTIPLRASKKDIAVVRHKIVCKNEADIKSGIINKYQFKDYFAWLNDKGTSELKLLSVKQASEEYLEAYRVENRVDSYRRVVISLNRFLDCFKSDMPIKSISIEDIAYFKSKYHEIHTPAGINLNLRNIKSFLRWCNDNSLIDSVPKIKMLREPKGNHKYIKEADIKRIFELDISPFMKRAFYLLYSTGLRRSEVIMGHLDGTILIVPPVSSKSTREREVTLNANQVEIVKEIRSELDKHYEKGSQLVTFKNKFTRVFSNACKKLKLDEGISLHSLRHTYAVIQWISTNDIYEVSKLLGHSSVKTTEKYAKFNMDRLGQDFPTAYKVRLEIEKIRKKAISTPLISTPILKINQSSSESLQSVSDC